MRKIRRIRKIESPCKPDAYPSAYQRQFLHELLVPCVTRMGRHKVGERGVFLSQANGAGGFFPERGGYTMVPSSHVRKIPIVHTPSTRKVIAAPTGKAVVKRKAIVRLKR